MSVSLNPSAALGFNRPLTVLVKRSLTITNHNAQPVAFKVKTTAPKLYAVRPNSGRVEPGQSVDVSVMLQPLKDEPPLTAKCKDKFLIQSTLITPGKEAMSLADIWTGTDAAGEEGKVHQQKLRVVYLPAEGQTLVEEDEEPHIANSVLTTGESRYDTVRQPPPANGEAAEQSHIVPSSPPRPPSPHADFSAAEDVDEHHSFEAPGVIVTPPQASEPAPVQEPVDEPAAAPAPEPEPTPIPVLVSPPAPAPRTPSVPTPATLPLPAPLPPAEDYAAKYAEAQSEIERLRALLATSQPPAELRRRTRRLSDEATAVDVAVLEEASIQEGVPLQIVVIIALGVFITTYLFF